MTFIKAFFYRLLLVTGIMALLPTVIIAIPLNNIYDPQPLYNYHCTDKVYKKRSGREFRFHISPFYQHANTARNKDGKKVAGGDRLGPWNFFGLFFDGRVGVGDTTLASKAFNSDNYPKLYEAQQAVGNITTVVNNDAAVIINIAGAPLLDGATPAVSPYRLGTRASTAAYTANVLGDMTFKPQFEKLQPDFALVSVPTRYEKIGVRVQMNFDMGMGLGISVRGGAVEIKNKPRGFGYDSKIAADLGLASLSDMPAYTPNDQSKADAQAFNDNLLSAKALGKIGKELNYNTSGFHVTSPEDVHTQVYWHAAIPCRDKSGDVGVTVVPYVGFGAWIPLSEKFDTNNAFAVPVSNRQQSFGATADFSLGFDFPVLPSSKSGKESLGISFGGGGLLFDADTQTNQRFPSSDTQVGLIPWTVGSVRCAPGGTWYLNASLKAEEFVEGLSVYTDFCYTQHEQDTISVSDSNSGKQALFQEGVAQTQDDSGWKNQQVSVGFNYAITPTIAFSAAAQGHISGVRVHRTVTILGGLTVTF